MVDTAAGELRETVRLRTTGGRANVNYVSMVTVAASVDRQSDYFNKAESDHH